MEKGTMIEMLVSYYSNGNKAKFAAKIGIKAQTLSAWIARNTFDAELLYKMCGNISAEWLLSGEGDMLKSTTNNAITHGDGSVAVNNNSGLIETEVNLSAREQISLLEKLLEEKERLIEEKERLINVLLNK